MEPKSLEYVLQEIGFGKFQFLLITICGILQMFEAVEVFILAYLKPMLKCNWQTNLWEESFLMMSVFIGMMIGSIIMGRFSDMYGRKPILLISSIFLGYLGLLCAGAPSMVWVAIIRSGVGFGLGGVMSSLFTFASELTSVKYRGMALTFILIFWPMGSYLTIILSVTIVPVLGWRGFLGISSMPLLLILPVFIWLPESPRFLLLKNMKVKALRVLNTIASINKTHPITDVLQPSNIKSSWRDVFHKNYLSTTFLTVYLWMTSGLTYYGIVLIVTVIDNTPRQCLQNMNTYHKPSSNFTKFVDDSCCMPITWSNSINSIISITGELVFIPVALLMVQFIGRKYSLAIFYIFISVSFIVINFCMSTLLMRIFLFTLRGSIYACFNVNYLYVSEVFPTSVRSIASGLCGASTRIGAMMSPFIINVIINNHSFFYGTIIFTCFNFVASIASLLLPYETRGRPLFQTAEEYKLVPVIDIPEESL